MSAGGDVFVTDVRNCSADDVPTARGNTAKKEYGGTIAAVLTQNLFDAINP